MNFKRKFKEISREKKWIKRLYTFNYEAIVGRGNHPAVERAQDELAEKYLEKVRSARNLKRNLQLRVNQQRRLTKLLTACENKLRNKIIEQIHKLRPYFLSSSDMINADLDRVHQVLGSPDEEKRILEGTVLRIQQATFNSQIKAWRDDSDLKIILSKAPLSRYYLEIKPRFVVEWTVYAYINVDGDWCVACIDEY